MDEKELKTEEVLNNEGVAAEAAAEAVVAPEVNDDAKSAPKRSRDTRGAPGNRRGGPMRRGGRRDSLIKPEFDQKIIGMRRVTRVVAGGRRMSFSVSIVAGNRKGKVGVGVGKATDTALAIEKAFRDAKKNMIVVPLTKTNSIPHDVKAKYGASVVTLAPARGRGLVAGGAVRHVLELAGVTDISSKILSRSKNGINNARAALKALTTFKTRRTFVKKEVK